MHTKSPMVIDEPAGRGFLYETGGFLRMYDLVGGSEAWSKRIVREDGSPTTSLEMNVGVIPGTDVIIVADPTDPYVHGSSALDGSVLWTRSLSAVVSSFCVLEDGVVLLCQSDGAPLRGINASGDFTGSIASVPGPVAVIGGGGRLLTLSTNRLTCLVQCPVDLAEPYGALNVFDFLGFQTLFSEEDPRADLAPPFGVFNAFDFLAFQTAFGNGCE